jgi:hypothetical protein
MRTKGKRMESPAAIGANDVASGKLDQPPHKDDIAGTR